MIALALAAALSAPPYRCADLGTLTRFAADARKLGVTEAEARHAARRPIERDAVWYAYAANRDKRLSPAKLEAVVVDACQRRRP